MVYLPTFYHIYSIKNKANVGKYASPMDGMGYGTNTQQKSIPIQLAQGYGANSLSGFSRCQGAENY